MNFVQEAAIRALRGVGCRIFLPPKPPPIGTVWTPTRGQALPRAVFATTLTHVTYGHGSTRATITLRAWHGWRGHTRAKCGGDAP